MSPLIPPRACCDSFAPCEHCGDNTCERHGTIDRARCTHAVICGDCSLLHPKSCQDCAWDAAS